MEMVTALASTVKASPFGTATLTLYLVTASTLLLCLLSFKRRRHSANLPPGPLGLPIIGSIPFLSGDLHRDFAALAARHGPVLSLRLGAKLFVVLSSPSTARAALKDQDALFANHDPSAAALVITYNRSDVVFAPYGALWRTLRKVCVRHLLSAASIDAISDLRRAEVRRSVSSLAAAAGRAVEVREVAFATSLGVMRRMLWGEGDVDEGVVGAAAEFREVVDGIMDLMEAPNVSDFFPAVARWDLMGIERRMKVLAKRFDGIFEAIMERRGRDGGANKSAGFLQVMLELMEKGDNETELTLVHVKALLLDLIAAGTDTTSTTVEWAMAELLNNPDKMRKVQEELDEVVGEDRILEESDLPEFPFLSMVVKEVLRLHPPIPLLVPHNPTSDAVIDGYTIPKEAKVFVNAWAIQRDPASWEDATKFMPERFLNSKEKYDYNGSNFNFFPFGSGRRICAGSNLAEKMIMYELASFLHSFEWRLPEGTTLDLKEKFAITLKKKEALVAIPTMRLSNFKLYD